MPTELNRGASIARSSAISLRRPGVILMWALVIAAFATLVSLGNWQMRRLTWKEALIASASQRPALPPLDWSDPATRATARTPGFIDEFGYRAVRLEGQYLGEKEARVFTSLPSQSAQGPASGPGYWIMTPFQLGAAGPVVWVNRGFVPEGLQWAAPPAGPVTVLGLIRPDDPPHWLTPENRPDKNLFFARSLETLSAAKDLGPMIRVEAFTVDLLPQSGAPALPQAGETRVTFTNTHLGYAITWYGLAAALVAVFASYLWSRRREGSQGPRLTQPGGHT